ncbi:MAG TPA: hypothetical protein VE954_22515 [Oligoflexus sp.]|uniref:hypothetical protein n=1 Tax=Oligoflexus sp. TaxID=1971216 RepID=UPI002D4EFA4B|nr:hypothetical protein [Oligoflexus sp.]HYX35883.1 hypothetical protein [Oligoflexus sp.]
MKKVGVGSVALALMIGASFYFQSSSEGEKNKIEPLVDKVAADVKQLKKSKGTAESNGLSPEEETQRLLKEAANKRFKVDRPVGMLTDDRDIAEDLTRQVAVEMLLETLIREKIEKIPEYVQETEARMMTREPRLLTLMQKDSQGEMREAQVLVADTRACQDRVETKGPVEVRVEDLESEYCMHPTLEYPGGFDTKRPLLVTVGSVTERGKFADMDRQWERMLKIELRQTITAEFVPRYQSTGALTL